MGAVALVLFWPALFAMDFKNGAGKEIQSVQQRQAYLGQLIVQKHCGGQALTAAR